MALHLRRLIAVAFLLFAAGLSATAQEGEKGKGEMVDNPFYKWWSGFKKGATAVRLEKSTLEGAEGKDVPDRVDEKQIRYRLVEVNEKRVVVEMVVREREFLGYIVAAPTRHIYPAKVKRAHLERFLKASGARKGEETIKFRDREMKCTTVTGTVKAPGGEETTYKLWLNDEVPGRIVKEVRTTRKEGKTIAETTTTLQAYKMPE